MSHTAPKGRVRWPRLVQIVGMILCIVGIFFLIQHEPGSWMLAAGFLLIVVGRAYEWVVRE